MPPSAWTGECADGALSCGWGRQANDDHDSQLKMIADQKRVPCDTSRATSNVWGVGGRHLQGGWRGTLHADQFAPL